MQWPADAVVYQIYPRSFLDSNGDGVGDLAGVERGLDHVAGLGADALWLSPIYPSPGADLGYDVSDFREVDPLFGDLADLDRLIAGAHSRGLRVLMDLVPCHTSIEHPWFCEHPDWYVWADVPNNWIASFGGSAWSPDPGGGGRWYLHSFYPEQPDLDWRNPEVVEAMGGVISFWLDRGVDGFRLDAIDRLMKDPLLRDEGPATRAFPLPLPEEAKALDLSRSRDAPDIGLALAAIRRAAGDAYLVGEAFLPAHRQDPYLEHLDAVFSFEFFHAPWEATALRTAIEDAARLRGRHGKAGTAWVLSNHDFSRLASRAGEENVRAAAVLLLSLPGAAFVYQGEEIGQGDGPDDRTYDRWGRDAHRGPVQWTAEPRRAGFTTGTPWLPAVDARERNLADQDGDPGSLLALYRRMVELRRELPAGMEMLPAADGVVAYARGNLVVAVNTSAHWRPLPREGDLVLESDVGACRSGRLAPHAAAITRTRVGAFG